MLKINVKKDLFSVEGNTDLHINLEIEKGDFITLFGKSGAGKTTILRIISGLTIPEEGYIKVNDKVWFDDKNKINLPCQKRNIGFVFQDYSLFPNMSVRENLVFALGNKKDKGTIDNILNLIHLKEIENRKPDTLSGGQKQRVALARALVRKPDILLLDEPLSALDFEMRSELQNEILNIYRNLGITIILVTHDLTEIFKLSNKVFIIDKGRVSKFGTPAEIFTNTKITGKFTFIGEVIDIKKNDVVYILTVLTGINLVKVIATEEEVLDMKIGQRVLVTSKAFNPLIIKI